VPDYGFATELRLNKAAEYRAVFSTAKYKVSCRYLLIFAIRNDLSHPRVGIIVGKKHVAKAVQRNRIKRVARDFFRLNQSLLGGLDIVILVRNNLSTIDNSKITQQLDRLCQDLINKAT
jgi:ribonuclease P protein component